MPHPTNIKSRTKSRVLEVSFDDGSVFELPYEYLRVFSPSAEVQGHSPEQRKLVYGKQAVEILKIEPVGNYAVKLHFDDMHNTGLYSWSYLAKLGRDHGKLWPAYLEELAEKGFSREPASHRTAGPAF